MNKLRIVKSKDKTTQGAGGIGLNNLDENCLIINSGTDKGVYLGVKGDFGECIANFSDITAIPVDVVNSMCTKFMYSGAPINEALIEDSISE